MYPRFSYGSDHSSLDAPFDRSAFLAENTDIEILPSFNQSSIKLIDRTLGPFRPDFPITVPLWFAIQLRLQHRCSIVCPTWMSPASLSSALVREKNDSRFTVIPYHYLEISRLLLAHARDDLPHASQIIELLSDFQDLRSIKMRRGVLTWTPGDATTTTRMNQVGSIEIQTIKQFTISALGTFKSVAKLGSQEDDQSNNQSNNQSVSQSVNDSQPGAQSSREQRQKAFRGS